MKWLSWFFSQEKSHKNLLKQAEVLRKAAHDIEAFVEQDRKFEEEIIKANPEPQQEYDGQYEIAPGVLGWKEEDDGKTWNDIWNEAPIQGPPVPSRFIPIAHDRDEDNGLYLFHTEKINTNGLIKAIENRMRSDKKEAINKVKYTGINIQKLI